jgi:hypothetical protein
VGIAVVLFPLVPRLMELASLVFRAMDVAVWLMVSVSLSLLLMMAGGMLSSLELLEVLAMMESLVPPSSPRTDNF